MAISSIFLYAYVQIIYKKTSSKNYYQCKIFAFHNSFHNNEYYCDCWKQPWGTYCQCMQERCSEYFIYNKYYYKDYDCNYKCDNFKKREDENVNCSDLIKRHGF